MLVYVLSGVLAGLGAVLYLAQFGTTTIAGQSLTNLNVIAAVVIGGTSIFGGEGSMFGTVVGLFIPAVLQSGFVIIGVQPFWQGVAVGVVLIAAVYVDQTRRAAALRGAQIVPTSRSKRRAVEKWKETNEAVIAGAIAGRARALAGAVVARRLRAIGGLRRSLDQARRLAPAPAAASPALPRARAAAGRRPCRCPTRPRRTTRSSSSRV